MKISIVVYLLFEAFARRGAKNVGVVFLPFGLIFENLVSLVYCFKLLWIGIGFVRMVLFC